MRLRYLVGGRGGARCVLVHGLGGRGRELARARARARPRGTGCSCPELPGPRRLGGAAAPLRTLDAYADRGPARRAARNALPGRVRRPFARRRGRAADRDQAPGRVRAARRSPRRPGSRRRRGAAERCGLTVLRQAAAGAARRAARRRARAPPAPAAARVRPLGSPIALRWRRRTVDGLPAPARRSTPTCLGAGARARPRRPAARDLDGVRCPALVLWGARDLPGADRGRVRATPGACARRCAPSPTAATC